MSGVDRMSIQNRSPRDFEGHKRDQILRDLKTKQDLAARLAALEAAELAAMAAEADQVIDYTQGYAEAAALQTQMAALEIKRQEQLRLARIAPAVVTG
jgi:hypothetical protein